jgi:hypothetical protein
MLSWSKASLANEDFVKLDWTRVKADHVAKAVDILKHQATKGRETGLFLLVGGQRLPAKQVLRIAYSIASGVSVEDVPKFSSGEGSVKLLESLGFGVQRIPTRVDRPE